MIFTADRAKKLQDDGGFSIVESMMSLFVLALVLTMAGVTFSSSLNHLKTARVKAMASNLAQARVEDMRILPYSEVGTLTGSPVGAIPASEVITVGGIDFDVAYVVEYEGSATGNDVIPGGGDGVPTGYDTGIDYKRVEVTVIDSAARLRQPVVMETLVAPPNAAANDGISHVRVELVPQAVPATVPTLPRVCLLKGVTVVRTANPDSAGIAFFPAVDPNGTTVGAFDYLYTARIGSLCGTEFNDWFILPTAVADETDSVHVESGQTGVITLPISLKQELHVEAYLGDVNGVPVDDAGDPLTPVSPGSGDWQDPVTGLWYDLSGQGEPAEGARLIFNVSDTFTDGTAPDALDGEWTITQLLSGYLTAGTYDLQVEFAGYNPASATGVVVPDVPVVTVVLKETAPPPSTTTTVPSSSTTIPSTTTTVPTGPVTVAQCLYASNAANGADYRLAGFNVVLDWTESGAPQQLTQTTDASGCYTATIPGDADVTRTISGERGFADPVAVTKLPDDLNAEGDLRVFPLSGYVVVTVYNLDATIPRWDRRQQEGNSNQSWVRINNSDITDYPTLGDDDRNYTWALDPNPLSSATTIQFTGRCGRPGYDWEDTYDGSNDRRRTNADRQTINQTVGEAIDASATNATSCS